jgi:pSer/pThr/pTyr-binding forkhead associated (FHA) protein
MARLTVFFKDKAIHSDLFENGVIHIGRDETNDLTIDSLAVAPAHAALVIRDGSCIIKQLNDDFPLIVNRVKVKECHLNNNDTISVGKHDIIYNTTESASEQVRQNAASNKDSKPMDHKTGAHQPITAANLQVMDGPNIGKILLLKNAMTRLGHSGSGMVVISRRKEGYFIAALENKSQITVNNQPLDDNSLKLSNNDVIVIDGTSLQFFLC